MPRKSKRSYSIDVAAPELCEAVQAEIGQALDVIEKHWGFRPQLDTHFDGMLYVHADFNLKGFAHKGAGVFVKPSNLARVTPREICRRIVGELVQHRNTCKECGTNTIGLWERVYRQKRGAGRDALALNPEYNVPPDPVEQYLFPGLSRQLAALLESKEKRLADRQAVLSAYVDLCEGRDLHVGGALHVRNTMTGKESWGSIVKLSIQNGCLTAELEVRGVDGEVVRVTVPIRGELSTRIPIKPLALENEGG